MYYLKQQASICSENKVWYGLWGCPYPGEFKYQQPENAHDEDESSKLSRLPLKFDFKLILGIFFRKEWKLINTETGSEADALN